MEKSSFILISILCCILLSGCGAENRENTTVVAIDKSGKVIADIVETFDKEYYDQSELESTIKSDISEFNTSAGMEKVTLDQVRVEEQKAYAKITYADCKSYEAFNDVVLFQGSVSEAKEAGYSLQNVMWKDAEEKSVTLSEEQLMDEKIIIFEEPIHLRIQQNIQYVSEQVTLVNKKEAAANLEEGQFAYILYK